MPSRALGIMAKVPLAGAVKTRLTPPLTGEQATLLYRAFLRDTILLGQLVPACATTVIFPPATDSAPLHELLPADVDAQPQTRAGLGEGLRDAFAQLWQRGAHEVVLVGSDAPTLPLTLIEDAFRALELGGCDVVLGPADDGGYYLIGLRDDRPELFEDIDWSSDRVLAQTLDRAASAGLRVAMMAGWYDIDDGASLTRLVEDLGRDPQLQANATRAALQTLRRMGAPLSAAPVPWEVTGHVRSLTSPWRNLDVEQVRTHTGARIEYSYFTTPDAVWVVPVTRAGEIILVRQYRHPVRDWCLEVPAGSVAGESLADTAARELREEVGGSSDDLRFVAAFYSASAHLTLRGHVFLALDVELRDTALEETEMLVPVRLPADMAFDMARRGEINEGESAMAVLMCEPAIRAHLAR